MALFHWHDVGAPPEKLWRQRVDGAPSPVTVVHHEMSFFARSATPGFWPARSRANE